jgi:hypothetical protein
MIEDDKLIRETRILNHNNIETFRRDCVITKEEFLECYNEWVIKPKRKNPISIQTDFYIPADNDGGTPV